MKKKFLFLTCAILCTACDNANIPENIKSFINGIDFRVVTNDLRSGEFKQTYEEKFNEEISGRNSIDFSFSKNEDEMNFHALYKYEGNQVKDNVLEKEVTLTYISEENYKFEVRTNEDVVSSTLNYQQAYNKYYLIFDSGVNSYRVGGLYYGDFFAINMNKFYQLYSLNDEETILSMKEEDAPYYDKLHLTQQIDIDKNGMLLYKKERAFEPGSTNYGLLEQVASYIYA